MRNSFLCPAPGGHALIIRAKPFISYLVSFPCTQRPVGPFAHKSYSSSHGTPRMINRSPLGLLEAEQPQFPTSSSFHWVTFPLFWSVWQTSLPPLLSFPTFVNYSGPASSPVLHPRDADGAQDLYVLWPLWKMRLSPHPSCSQGVCQGQGGSGGRGHWGLRGLEVLLPFLCGAGICAL